MNRQYSAEAESWIESLQESLRGIEQSEDFQILEDFELVLEADPFGKKYNATCLNDVLHHIQTEVAQSTYNRLSDDLKNDPERAILNYYNGLLTDSILEPNDDVPDWVFEFEELSYFKESA
ncbi:hypothetical protein [Alteromonas sp. 14N.309.X.WAT.G.H12]|uniref:hypothetical protein n=1 Tax=Alteromonas sp. 14N.309.X.WAT.G.H12 TaxID=3120824 RepID=UPI002FD2D9F6